MSANRMMGRFYARFEFLEASIEPVRLWLEKHFSSQASRETWPPCPRGSWTRVTQTLSLRFTPDRGDKDVRLERLGIRVTRARNAQTRRAPPAALIHTKDVELAPGTLRRGSDSLSIEREPPRREPTDSDFPR